jgi:hypothetical protein
MLATKDQSSTQQHNSDASVLFPLEGGLMGFKPPGHSWTARRHWKAGNILQRRTHKGEALKAAHLYLFLRMESRKDRRNISGMVTRTWTWNRKVRVLIL